jgi:hypothetical protein
VIKLSELSETFESLDHEPARTRYSPPVFNRNWPIRRRGKYMHWRIEQVIVPAEVWRSFANETQRGYYGQNGSRRLHVVFYMNEEMGKFTTKARAVEYIQEKENG